MRTFSDILTKVFRDAGIIDQQSEIGLVLITPAHDSPPARGIFFDPADAARSNPINAIDADIAATLKRRQEEENGAMFRDALPVVERDACPYCAIDDIGCDD